MEPGTRSGNQLRELRSRLGVTTREVEELSKRIAVESENEEFYISNAWLTQIENRNSVPSIYKLFSLSVIYRTKFTDLLAAFGVLLDETMRYQLSTPLQNTHLATLEAPADGNVVNFPVRFDRASTWKRLTCFRGWWSCGAKFRFRSCRSWICATASTDILAPTIPRCIRCFVPARSCRLIAM